MTGYKRYEKWQVTKSLDQMDNKSILHAITWLLEKYRGKANQRKKAFDIELRFCRELNVFQVTFVEYRLAKRRMQV